jgi:hypothetical protein
MKKKTFLLVLCLLILIILAKAQTYEIRAVNKGGGVIGVEMRATSGTPPTTNNFVTDLVFGLKWQSSYNVNLLSTITSNYKIKKSDERKLKNGYYYQAFFADNTPFNFPATWTLNTWVEILSIANDRKSDMDTGTFAITEKGFDVTTDPNIGVDLTDYTPSITGSAVNVPLPLNLLKLDATPVGRTIKVEWITAGEKSTKGFEVQRSDRESDNFKTISWIDSKGNSGSEKSYGFVDEDVTVKVRYYYRLKLLDYDGQFSYSEIRTTILTADDNNAVHITPNPADKVLQVYFDNSIAREIVTLKVVDAKGSVVLSKRQYVDRNTNTNLNVSNLAAGQYFLIIQRDKEAIYEKAFQKN